jgi:hypothetical protein
MELFSLIGGSNIQTPFPRNEGEQMNKRMSFFFPSDKSRLCGCAGIGYLLCVVGLVASTVAAPPQTTGQGTLDSDKLALGWFAGTVMSIPNANRMLTVNVAYQKLQLKPGQNLARSNQGLQLQYNRILQLQNQMNRPPSRGHNPMQAMQQLQNAMNQFQVQLAGTEANMFQAVKATQKVDFQVAENVKVRMRALPEQFDEKGNIKKYSAEELAALKGKDKHLPGYESSLESLKPGQIVQVKLSTSKKPRPATASRSSNRDGSKEATKEQHASADKDKDASTEHKNQVGLIVILKDNDSEPSSTNPAKSKNK